MFDCPVTDSHFQIAYLGALEVRINVMVKAEHGAHASVAQLAEYGAKRLLKAEHLGSREALGLGIKHKDGVLRIASVQSRWVTETWLAASYELLFEPKRRRKPRNNEARR